MFNFIFNTICPPNPSRPANMGIWHVEEGVETLQLPEFKNLLIRGRGAVWFYPNGELITVNPETGEITQNGVCKILMEMYNIIEPRTKNVKS